VPFLRAAAQTLHYNLDAESFLGRWEENGFLVVLPTASPVKVATTAETLRTALSHSEVSWWGDHFTVAAEVACAVVATGDDLESLLRELKPAHSSATPKAAAAAKTKTF
jgi:GGDEF domain-containing protein